MNDYAETRATLAQRLSDLLSRAEKVDQDLAKPGPQDWDDNALESEDDEVLEAVGLATMKEARLIREAITAIDERRYGACTDCGAQISPERLQALPEATQCIRCA